MIIAGRQNRTKQTLVRLTPAEWELVRKLAQQQQMSGPEVIRAAVREYAERRGVMHEKEGGNE